LNDCIIAHVGVLFTGRYTSVHETVIFCLLVNGYYDPSGVASPEIWGGQKIGKGPKFLIFGE